MDQHLTPRPSSRYGAWIPPVEVTYRVGDVERAAACDALADHFAAGRLDPTELDDRLARAMASRSQEDLRVLLADLDPRRTPDPARRTTSADDRPEPTPGGGLVPVLATVILLCLLLAGGMLVVLGAYDPALFVGALVGGTATAAAGSCATVLAQKTLRRR